MLNLIYDKAAKYPIGHGYDRRIKPGPSSILVHATHGNPGTTSDAEARFLYQSPDVSAHYLIGRDGTIYQFLDPKFRAWHAGSALTPWVNENSIGIELHAAVGEQLTTAQLTALTGLVRDLMERYGIPPNLIQTHRAAALPVGRKSDPAMWSQNDFLTWRGALTRSTSYRAKYTSFVRERPTTESNLLRQLVADQPINVVQVVVGQRLANKLGSSDQWAELSGGGYTWLPQLERVV